MVYKIDNNFSWSYRKYGMKNQEQVVVHTELTFSTNVKFIDKLYE